MKTENIKIEVNSKYNCIKNTKIYPTVIMEV